MIVREPENRPEPRNLVEALGRKVFTLISEIGRASMICIEGTLDFRYLFRVRARREVVRQLHICAVKSLPVVTVVAFFIGMILALQIGIELRRYNQETLIGPAVMASMLREMGPFMSGLVLAASVGAAMAAQIGTMMVNEEIAALEIMDISPVRFLVMPRLAAMMLTVPLLSFYTCMVGVVGGGLVSYTQLSVPWPVYWQNAMDFANMKALYVGLFKALLFGFTIVTVSCYEGFRTRNGAVGVGQATRQSVVTNFLVILVIGYFVTRLFY